MIDYLHDIERSNLILIPIIFSIIITVSITVILTVVLTDVTIINLIFFNIL